MRENLCDACGKPLAPYDSVHYGAEGGSRDLCGRCFNETVAQAGGLEFEHIQFDPIELTDAAGNAHQFHFRLHLFGDQVSLMAVELHDDDSSGYEFQALGDAEGDLFWMLAQLVARMKRALALRHLSDEGPFGTSIADQTVRARITWDTEEAGRVPLLVIDGREVTWQEFGRMLMTFEGFQFKLEIKDRSEEV